MTGESQNKRRLLDHEMTDTLTAQIELDKTAEEFRKAHAERQELIAQWENTIDQMQKRDREMDLLAAVSLLHTRSTKPPFLQSHASLFCRLYV